MRQFSNYAALLNDRGLTYRSELKKIRDTEIIKAASSRAEEILKLNDVQLGKIARGAAPDSTYKFGDNSRGIKFRGMLNAHVSKNSEK